MVPFATDTEGFYDLFTVEFEKGTEFSTRECLQYGTVSEALIICKVRPMASGVQRLDIRDTTDDRNQFIGFPLGSVMVQPSIFKKINKSMITYD